MDKNMILTADVLDIIFNGRNKAYGAYQLRKTYNKRLGYALLGTVAICLLPFWGNVLANAHKKTVFELPKLTEVNISNIKPDEPSKPVAPPPPPRTVQAQATTIASTTIRIVPNDQVIDPPPTVDELEHATISNITKPGIEGGEDGIVAPEQNTGGTGTVASLGKNKDVDNEFHTVQMPAEFPGGKDAWMRYLERNLNRDLPSQEGAPTGKYTVFVSFLVHKTGAISDIVAENDPQYGTAEEAVRVIKNGPSWKPAIQNGIAVAFRVRQAITFIVTEN